MTDPPAPVVPAVSVETSPPMLVPTAPAPASSIR